MDRKRRVYCRILTAATWIFIAASCADGIYEQQVTDIEIRLRRQGSTTKALLPEDEEISDASLMIFDANGLLEKHLYLDDGQTTCSVNLLRGQKYSIYACINYGEAFCPIEIESRSICIDVDIASLLEKII